MAVNYGDVNSDVSGDQPFAEARPLKSQVWRRSWLLACGSFCAGTVKLVVPQFLRRVLGAREGG